ncbi:MAG: Hsp20/alpha crystallin family protein [Candidatus Rokubacteria bacterium]|jgi:HSP20 family protein|nr:Hsp20/alpha crystallin family protein [Candidatus Rokubacteria bacterium]
MNALTPWMGMTALRKEMDRLFERFWETDFPEWPALGEWSPKLDVADTKEALVVTAEIPGIEPGEIGLTLQDQVLTIKGEKKHEKEEKEEQHYRMERSYGAFARTIRLPVPVDASRVTATFKNGLLTVTLPKGAVAKGTTIPIKAA